MQAACFRSNALLYRPLYSPVNLPPQYCNHRICISPGIYQGLKLVFSAVGFTWLGSNAIRYFAVVLMACVVWPLTFPWFAQLGAGKEPRG